MNCTCISDLEKKSKAHFVERGMFKKPIKSVVMKGVTLGITDTQCVTRTANYLEIELEGQKKKEQIAMFHTFCPFCGVKQGVEE
jgi:hypothetical protein